MILPISPFFLVQNVLKTIKSSIVVLTPVIHYRWGHLGAIIRPLRAITIGAHLEAPDKEIESICGCFHPFNQHKRTLMILNHGQWHWSYTTGTCLGLRGPFGGQKGLLRANLEYPDQDIAAICGWFYFLFRPKMAWMTINVVPFGAS